MTPSIPSHPQSEPFADFLSSVAHFVVDASFLDQKQRTLFDIPECRRDFYRFAEVHGLPRVRLGKRAKWVFY